MSHTQRTKGRKAVSRVEVVHASQERFTVAQVVMALAQAQGMVSVAARTLGCTRQTVYDYKTRHPEIDQALQDAVELQLDVTELKLFQAIQQGQPWAICFFLKTRGRQRGYIERHELTGGNMPTLEELVGAIPPRKLPAPGGTHGSQ